MTAAAHPSDPRLHLAGLSPKPGVYRLLDGAGKVLYVGKARNLRRRVTSYFRARGLDSKTLALTAKVADIDVTVTNSETEALLLEQSLIKKERPPYNVVLRDDKSYPYIQLTAAEDFPRLSFHRGARRKAARYFGPYPSASAVRESLSILQKLFRLRQCDDAFFKNRSRPCLQHQIQRCSAPCVGLIDRRDYRRDVALGVHFLEGRSNRVLEAFKENMHRASARLDFERAARYRDQIAQLRSMQEQQCVYAAEGDADVFAVVDGGGQACIQALFIRAGRMIGQRAWFPRNELGVGEARLLGAFLSQFYLGGGERDVPKSVIPSLPIDGADVLAAAMRERVGRRVEVAAEVRGQRARWRQLALDNANISLSAYLANKRNVFSRLLGLQEALGLEDTPNRLECFDISHTFGEATVASCVVFNRDGPLKSDYRRFNIKDVVRGDDYGAMEQALRRRYTRLRQGEGALPDVLVVDGGKGQAGRAAAVLHELQVQGVAVLGVAKGAGRKPGMERFFLEGEELALPPHSDAFHLLQHIRDEAHRFAVAGHRQKRMKRRRRSELDGVQGVGAKRRKGLLSHFGGLSALKGASVEEIAKAPGISRRLAEEVFGALHAE